MSNDNQTSSESSRPSHFDKLSDTLDSKMLDFNLKMLGVLGAILFKPAAVATEPFFRKNMGERYFTYTNGVLALMIWGGVGVLNKLFAGTWEFESQRTVGFAQELGGFIEGVFLILASANIAAARQRQTKGIRWHSTCRGESWFGSENSIRDWIITGVIVVVLYKLHAGLYAAFFLLSRIFSEYLESQRQQALYNRYLDIMDAQIESEYLQQTLAKGPAPMVTDGIYRPLPGRFNGEHREKVARVVAGTFSAPDVAAAPAASSPEAKAASMPDPLSQWAGQIKKGAGQIWKVLLEVYAVIGPKRLIRSVVILLAVVACVYGGPAIFRAVKAHWQRAAASPVAVIQPAPSKPVLTPSASPAAAPVQSQPVQTALAADPVMGAKPAAAPPVDPARSKFMEQFENQLAEETNRLSKFNGDCETRMLAETDRIAKVPPPDRTDLEQHRDRYQKQIKEWLQGQSDMLDKLRVSAGEVAGNPQLDPQKLTPMMKTYLDLDAAQRRSITFILDEMDRKISAALTTPPPQ